MVVDALINRIDEISAKSSVQRKLKLTRFEKATVGIISLVLITLMSASVYTRSVVSETTAIIEETKINIETVRVDNQILQQKIDDLMTYGRITSVANQYGLARHESNVKAVKK